MQDCGEHFQNGHEEPLGYGMLQRRKKTTPDDLSKLTIADVQQEEKCNEKKNLKVSRAGETMLSSMLGLLDLLDRQSGEDTKSSSEMSTLWNSQRDGKNSSCIDYFPAGANLKTCNRNSKNPGVMKSASLIDKDRHTSDARNDSYLMQCKDKRELDSTLGVILPDHTTAPLDTEGSEMQSSAVKHSEHFEQTAGEKQCKLLSLLDCLEGEVNSVSKNGSCRTKKYISMQQDVTEKETSSVYTRNFFQDIVNSVVLSAETKRKGVPGDVKNSLSQSSVPDMKARLPQAAHKAGNEKRAKPVHSLAR